MAELKEGIIGGAVNLYFIYKFLRILTTPWEKTDAFKLGVIGDNGKILKRKSSLKTAEEKESYTIMHRLVWKLKRLMEKIPFGKSRLASYAAALWLIKEEKIFYGTDEELQESFLTFLETDWKNNALILKENYEGDMDKKTFSNFRKEGIDIEKSSMKDVIKDFQNSDAPQFKGKSDKKKKEMAIAAKLSKEEVEIDEANLNDYAAKFKRKMGKTTYQTMTDWVDGIGELTKRENKTLKRVLKPFTEEVELEEALKPKDKKVVDSFYDEKEDDQPKATLSTDGKTLWIGGSKAAEWRKGKIEILHAPTGQYDQSVFKYMRKSIPKLNFAKEDVELDEEIFYWYLIKGNLEKGKVAFVGTEKQVKLKRHSPKFSGDYVMTKSRKDLKMGDKWKKSMGVSEAVEVEEAVNLKKLKKEYRKNEDKNYHSENYLLLAKAFGTKSEIKHVEEILKRNKKQGSTSQKDFDWMYKNINPYYDKIRNEEVETEAKYRSPRDYDDLGVGSIKYYRKKGEKKAKRKEEIEATRMPMEAPFKLVEMKWEVGVVYHQEFKNGDRAYFRADSVQKNNRWKGMQVDEFGGKQKKAKNSTANESLPGWVTTPKNEIPKALKEEVEIDEHCGVCGEQGIEEKKSATGYELYHKTFSDAMQHAYAFAKSKGHIVDPKEIDDKVATGPKKPSSGKTNRYSLKAGRKKVEIQVANLDNKRYELNMYIEGVELDEGSSDTQDMYALMLKGLKAMPGSPKQKEIIKKINVIRKRMGMPLMKEGALEEVESKYDKEIAAFKAKGGKVKKLKPSKPFKSMFKQKGPKKPPRKEEVEDERIVEGTDFPSFSKFIIEGRAKEGEFGRDPTAMDNIKSKYISAQRKQYTVKDIESIARKWKVKLASTPVAWDNDWEIQLRGGITLSYEYGGNAMVVAGWKYNKKIARKYHNKYEPHDESMDEMKPVRGKMRLRGFETAFDLVTMKEEVELTEELPANYGGEGSNVDLTPHKKKKKKKVEYEEFGGSRVYVVSPERFHDSRLGKSRYNRYEKYVGNDDIGEAIRQYGRANPKLPIILKNSGNGAMLYLKYGKKRG